MAKKYFLYSSEQLNFRKNIESKMGKTFKVGHVIVNGVRKPFTEISLTPTSRYADAKVVAEGDPNHLKHTMPSSR